ncbi:MAG: phosphoribosyltransferase family protein [Balneolales bacterium]
MMIGENPFLLMNASRTDRAITRIARQIVEDSRGQANIILFGIEERGDKLAQILSLRLEDILNERIPYHKLEVKHPGVDEQTTPPVNISGSNVIIIDDVIFSGKTMHHAFELVMRLGEPEWVRLAVLIDRGHRIYPIEAQYVGLVSPTKLNEHVSCTFDDGKPNGVWLGAEKI